MRSRGCQYLKQMVSARIQVTNPVLQICALHLQAEAARTGHLRALRGKVWWLTVTQGTLRGLDAAGPEHLWRPIWSMSQVHSLMCCLTRNWDSGSVREPSKHTESPPPASYSTGMRASYFLGTNLKRWRKRMNSTPLQRNMKVPTQMKPAPAQILG